MKNYNTKRCFDIDGKKRNIMKGGQRKGKFYYVKKAGNTFEKVNLTKKQVAGFMNDFMKELKIDLETFIKDKNKRFIDKGVVSDIGAQPLDEKDFPDIQYFTFTSLTSTQVYNKVLKYAENNNKNIYGYRIMHETNSNEYILTIEFIDNFYSNSPSSSMSSPSSSMSSRSSSMSSPSSSMSPWQDAQNPDELREDEEEYFKNLKNRSISNSPKVTQRSTKDQICQKIKSLNETQMSMLEDCLNKMSMQEVGKKRRL